MVYSVKWKDWKVGCRMVCIMSALIPFMWGTSVLAEDSMSKENTKISMHMKEAPLKSVVEGIAKGANVSIMGTDTLEGTISMRVDGESPKELLRRIGDMKQIPMIDHKGVLEIHGGKENFRSHAIRPQYASPQSVATAISTVIPTSRVQVVKETGHVVYYSNGQEEGPIRHILDHIDERPAQVLLEATVIAIEHGYRKELGVRWSGWNVEKSGGASTSSIGFSISPKSTMYRFSGEPSLHGKEHEGRTVVVARPSIMAMNGEEAKILIGERLPVLVESLQDGVSRTSVSYEESGIRLTYRPRINGDGYIDADISAEVSTPSLVPEMKAYRFTTREAKTRVRVKDGEVVVIGGLMDSRQGKQIEKIPILGDIPLLGHLFKHSRKSKDYVELFILLEAKVLHP